MVEEVCIDCKHCEIEEYGYKGRIGVSLLSCNICEEDNENKSECYTNKQ